MTISWDQVRAEVTEHLQQLVRFNTVNPPGNESQAADYLAKVAHEAGIEAQVIEGVPGRGNFVARIRGEGKARPLLLMGHSDVVSVERDRWTQDPFGGEVIDGQLWGRGSVDMKSQVAAELMIMLLIKRSGLTLDRDLIMTTFADEEAGGRNGAAFMWKNHRELIDAEYAINEGGGLAMNIGGKRFYQCQTGEKGTARLLLTGRGQPGHASKPLPDTAMLRTGRAAVRLSEHTFPTVMTKTVEQMLTSIGSALGGDVERQVNEALKNPTWEALSQLPLPEGEKLAFYSMTRNTAAPTVIQGGQLVNVIPSEVTLRVDGRIVPTGDPEQFAEDVRTLVGDDVDVELTDTSAWLESDPASDLFETIRSVMGEIDPGSEIVPYISTGATDAKSVPEIKVLGFMPIMENMDEYDRAHGHDERFSVSSLDFATRSLYEIVTRFCNARS